MEKVKPDNIVSIQKQLKALIESTRMKTRTLKLIYHSFLTRTPTSKHSDAFLFSFFFNFWHNRHKNRDGLSFYTLCIY